jgi:ubiquinone/menaquinone biosynthesis C-methylase UbiE
MTNMLGNVGEFTAVDTTEDSSWFVRFMDFANGLPEYVAVREAMAAALGDLNSATVLEVGCGTGDDARELAALVGPAGRVVGTDLSEAMIAEARRRGTSTDLPAEFVPADMRELPFEDGEFDAARAKLVRQHCPDVEAADDELVRVTRPGGRIAIFDYDFETLALDHPDRRTTREVVHCWVDGHKHGWIGRQLRRDFLDRGLRDVTVTPYTVLMPFEFFEVSMAGRLADAQRSGQLALSAQELADWWQPLREAHERDRFFASLTGYVLAATR